MDKMKIRASFSSNMCFPNLGAISIPAVFAGIEMGAEIWRSGIGCWILQPHQTVEIKIVPPL